MNICTASPLADRNMQQWIPQKGPELGTLRTNPKAYKGTEIRSVPTFCPKDLAP